MAVSFTAVEQDEYPPRVLLSLTGLTVGDSVELFRVVGGVRTAIRAGSDDAVTDTSFLRIDAELPFGVPVTYLALVNGEDYVYDTTRNTFDATAESWAGEGTTAVARVTSPVHDGAGSLRATKTMSSGLDSIRFNDNQGTRDISAAGPTLAAWTLVPADAAGTAWHARLELQDNAFAWNAGTEVALTPGTWTLISYTPPAGLMANCRSIGLQFRATGVNASQSVYIDTVMQGTSPLTTAAVTYVLPGGKVALSDAIAGDAAEVVILAWDEKDHDRDSTLFRVGGRNVAVVGDLGMFTSTIEFYVENTSSRDNLADLLASATEGVVQIRQPGGYDGVDSYLSILGAAERRFSQDGSDPRRIFAVRVAEVEAWGPTLEAAGFTLQDIADAYEGLTLADIDDDYATLLLLAQGDFS